MDAFEKPSETANAMEALALQLQASADYRVLRRLRPVQTPSPDNAQQRGVRIAIIDCETTGLDMAQDKVIDVGVLLLEVEPRTGRLLRVLGNWTGLEDPGFEIAQHISALTGITAEMVAGHAFDEQSLLEFLVGTDLVIAHNASFDRCFLEARFPWFERFAWACSHKLIRWDHEGIGSSKLEFIAFKAGFFYDGHRALVDCHALATALMSITLPSTGKSALCKILDVYGEPQYIVDATGAPFEAKDLLRLRGYRWHNEDRIWRLSLEQADLQDELGWLRTNIYTHKPARVQVEVRDALVRYSARQGLMEWRSVGPQGDSGRTFAASGRRTI